MYLLIYKRKQHRQKLHKRLSTYLKVNDIEDLEEWEYGETMESETMKIIKVHE